MNTPPVIYLAGKITKTDWRDAIVEHLSERLKKLPHLPPECTICGPDFIGWSHGCHHHSKAAPGKPDRANFSQPKSLRDQIPKFCREQMGRATAIFAWINCRDCFGTLVELGWAQALGIPIYLAFETSALAEEMWFVTRGPRTWSGIHSSAITGLGKALELFAEMQKTHLTVGLHRGFRNPIEN